MQLFSGSYLNEFDILKNAIIGLEFEFVSKLSYHNTLEVLNRKIDKKIHASKVYHSDLPVDENNWKLEPDLSGGFNCAELITHPMPYNQARMVIAQVFNILQEIATTTERTGLHINLSFRNKEIQSINPIKMVLLMDEDKVYRYFPDRKNNIYCKSVKDIIPFKSYDFSNTSSSILSSSLNLSSERFKYYGVNFKCLQEGRLEFRYIGGENYHEKTNEVLDLLDYFTITANEALNRELKDVDIKVLRNYLDDKISDFKYISKLDNLFIRYPSLRIQINKNEQYEVVKSYYSQLYPDIFTILSSVSSIKDCILNYDSEASKLEIVDAEIEVNSLMENTIFINCTITSGDFYQCEFFGCKIIDGIITSCNINDTLAINSKITNSVVDNASDIEDCFFTDGRLEGNMKGGIFRSGKIGQEAVISDDTEILDDTNDFFNFKRDSRHNMEDKTSFKYK